MLTYRDLRKVQKGISLYLIEVITFLGLFFYVYFFVPLSWITESNLKSMDFLYQILILAGSSIIFAFFYYFLFYTEYIGLLFQIFASIPVGYVISDITSKSVVLCILISALLLNLLYYLLLIRPLKKSQEQYDADYEANGKTQYKYLGEYEDGQKILFRKARKYESLNNKVMHILSNMKMYQDSLSPEFTYFTRQINQIKAQIHNELIELCTAEDEEFEQICKDLDIRFDELATDTESLHMMFNLLLANQREHAKQSHYETNEERIHDKEHNYEERNISNHRTTHSDFDFFLGCKDQAMLQKRYRDLMKAYHSDGLAGNEDIAKDINIQYERAKNSL